MMSEATFVTVIGEEMAESDSGTKRAKKTYTDRYDLLPLFMLKRDAELYGRGGLAHGDRNWEKSHTADDMAIARRSMMHHLFLYLLALESGEQMKEDHPAAIRFNITMMEWIRLGYGKPKAVIENEQSEEVGC